MQSEQPAKNRLNPIKETMQTVRGYPSTLVIYKISASRFYWSRCYFNGKYKVKTTKSENVKSAKEFAAKFYKDTLLSSITTKSSNDSFEEFGDLVHHQVTLVLSVLRKKHIVVQRCLQFRLRPVVHQVAVDVN